MRTRSAVTGKPFPGELGRDRFARDRDAGRRTVPVVAVPHGSLDGGDQMRRRLETECVGVANVQVPYAEAGGLHTLGLEDDVADGIAEGVDAARDRDAEATFNNIGSAHEATIQRRDSSLFWHGRSLKRVVLTEHGGHLTRFQTGLGR